MVKTGQQESNRRMIRRHANLLGTIQLIVGIGAIPAGLSMLFEPSGKGVGMTTEILRGTPFHNFFIPGIFLFLVNGLISVLCSIISFKKNRHGGTCGIVLGSFLVLWVVIQVYFIGLIHILQPLFLSLGIIEVIVGYRYKKKVDFVP